jgi:hypothetical protein
LPQTTCSRRSPAFCSCRFAERAPSHHDILVNVESDVAMALELMEMAATWEELDYSGEVVIPPHEWMEFATAHPWRDADVATRLFSVATDVALRSAAPVFVSGALR